MYTRSDSQIKYNISHTSNSYLTLFGSNSEFSHYESTTSALYLDRVPISTVSVRSQVICSRSLRADSQGVGATPGTLTGSAVSVRAGPGEITGTTSNIPGYLLDTVCVGKVYL